jgi:DNA-binding XRE family transcriptional regulator
MAHARYLEDKAIQLRRERNLTIDDLAERLALHRSTIYYWVKDIPIARKPNDGWPASARRKGTRNTVSITYLRARMQAWMDCIRDEWEHADRLDRVGA